jgi:hypothetical protein
MSSHFSFAAQETLKEIRMKTANSTKGLLFGASLLLASAAFAGEKASVKLYEDVKVNGKTLTAGNYELTWEGSGTNVQVNIRQGKEIVATVAAQVKTAASAPSTGYSTKKEDDGSTSLTNFFFAGKKYSLSLEQQAAATPAQAASSPGNQ